MKHKVNLVNTTDPGEFITACLNTAANDEDIMHGAELAKLYGLTVTTPKFGLSGANYTYDPDKKIIGRGLESIKFISKKTASCLKRLSEDKSYNYFIDLLSDIAEIGGVDSRQISILIKLNFFDVFGNQRELQAIQYCFEEILNKGGAKSIRKTKAELSGCANVFIDYADGKKKDGGEAASWTILDMIGLMHGIETEIKGKNMPDLTISQKARVYADVAGYVGFVTGVESDRSTLYVKGVKPVKRKSDGKVFGHSVSYQSIGSGKDGSMTVLNKKFNEDPINVGDVVRCLRYARDGKFFKMLDYKHIYD